MMKAFKDALCSRIQPDADFARIGNYVYSCKRRRGHQGFCRVAYRDGKYRIWSAGDPESRVVTKIEALKS